MNPLLTADEAREWLTGVGFCLYQPRRAQIAAPAASFVEAVMGAATEAPARETLEAATALLHRLTADGAAIPLNLLGAASAVGGSDVPDFLATRETLPYVFSLIGGRNWKSGPGAKASPLMTEVWTLLNTGGARTAQEIQTELGRELTEAAVLRALMELWNGLRVLPVYDGDGTRWELTQARFAAEMTASQKVAQATALSALVSLYLESSIAASTEDIESFLSPLSARSRVREVVNGLQATRQLGLVSVAAQPLLHIAGALPEFAEEPEQAEAASAAREGVESRPRVEGRAERKPFERKPFEHKPFERKERKPFQREDRFAARGGEERPRRERGDQERGGFGRKPFERKPFERRGEGYGAERREERGGERRPFRSDRPQREGRSFGGKKFGGGKSFGAKRPFFRERSEGSEERKPRTFDRERREGDRPQREGRSFGGKKFGGAKPFGAKRPFFRDRGEGAEERKPRTFDRERREGDRPARREGGWKPQGGKPGFKRDGERSFQRQQRPEFRREGERPARREGKPEFRREGRPDFKRASKPKFEGGERKRFERPSKPFGKPGKPFEKFSKGPAKGPKTFGKSGKSFSKDKPGFGKAGFGKRGSSKPGFGKPGFGKSGTGKPGFGARKPGGFKPPARKRKSEERGDAE